MKIPANQFNVILFLVIFLFGFLGCSDNSTDPNENESEGETSITVTGDFEAEKNGTATILAGGIETSWGIHISDNGSFDLNISTVTFNPPITRPAPGTYEIGEDVGDATVFSASYSEIGNNMEYGTTPCEDSAPGGNLTIESSNDEAVSGRFEFDADSWDVSTGECVVNGSITISGEFTAHSE